MVLSVDHQFAHDCESQVSDKGMRLDSVVYVVVFDTSVVVVVVVVVVEEVEDSREIGADGWVEITAHRVSRWSSTPELSANCHELLGPFG